MHKIKSVTYVDGKLRFHHLIMYQIVHQFNETENQVNKLINITIKQIHTYISIKREQ